MSKIIALREFTCISVHGAFKQRFLPWFLKCIFIFIYMNVMYVATFLALVKNLDIFDMLAQNIDFA